MGFMNQKYVPYCCLVFVTQKKKYLTKIIKCDEEIILKNNKSIELFKTKVEKGQLSEKEIFLYERSQIGDEVYIWECIPIKKDKITNHDPEKNPIDIFFGIGEGRVYVEEGRFNTEDEGKRNLLDDNGYLIENPNYRFRGFEKDNDLFRYCKLG
jgi:glutamate synthase domain-containing protein 1